jgi:hypothetical protein
VVLSSTFKTWKARSQKWDLTFRPSWRTLKPKQGFVAVLSNTFKTWKARSQKWDPHGATTFYGVRGDWSGIATGYLLVYVTTRWRFDANFVLKSVDSYQPIISVSNFSSSGNQFACSTTGIVFEHYCDNFVGHFPHRDKDYSIRSNFWKFYLIRISFTLGEPVSFMKVFRLFRLEWIVLVFRVWTQ